MHPEQAACSSDNFQSVLKCALECVLPPAQHQFPTKFNVEKLFFLIVRSEVVRFEPQARTMAVDQTVFYVGGCETAEFNGAYILDTRETLFQGLSGRASFIKADGTCRLSWSSAVCSEWSRYEPSGFAVEGWGLSGVSVSQSGYYYARSESKLPPLSGWKSNEVIPANPVPRRRASRLCIRYSPNARETIDLGRSVARLTRLKTLETARNGRRECLQAERIMAQQRHAEAELEYRSLAQDACRLGEEVQHLQQEVQHLQQALAEKQTHHRTKEQELRQVQQELQEQRRNLTRLDGEEVRLGEEEAAQQQERAQLTAVVDKLRPRKVDGGAGAQKQSQSKESRIAAVSSCRLQAEEEPGFKPVPTLQPVRPAQSCADTLLGSPAIVAAVPGVKTLVSDVERHIESLRYEDDLPVGLNEDEMFALAAFTYDHGHGKKGNLYYELNSALRERSPAQRQANLHTWGGFIFYMLSALAKLPDVVATVYRGVLEPSTFVRHYKAGRPIQWGSFSSTTTSRRTAASMAGVSGIVIEISVQTGKDVGPFSFYPQEHELLLGPNMHFVVARPCQGGHGETQELCLVQVVGDTYSN